MKCQFYKKNNAQQTTSDMWYQAINIFSNKNLLKNTDWTKKLADRLIKQFWLTGIQLFLQWLCTLTQNRHTLKYHIQNATQHISKTEVTETSSSPYLTLGNTWTQHCHTILLPAISSFHRSSVILAFQQFLGWPHFRLPSAGDQFRDCFASLLSSIQWTWPNHLNCLLVNMSSSFYLCPLSDLFTADYFLPYHSQDFSLPLLMCRL
jgi:hypothetical protein